MNRRRYKTKETIHDQILGETNENNIQTPNETTNLNKKNITPLTFSHTYTKKFKSMLKKKQTDSSDEDADDSDSGSFAKISGFESMVHSRKRIYYKKIKRKNRKRVEEENHRRRIEILVKFILYILSNFMNVLAVL